MNGEKKEFDLVQHFQPVVDMKEFKISHYEVLLRGDKKYVDIGSFVENLEKEGKIFNLDSWNLIVLAKKIAKDTEFAHGKPCAINLSANTIEDSRFDTMMNEIYNILGEQSSRMNFEITETAEINSFERVNRFVEKAALYNCSVSIDDFGSGYADNNYMELIDADKIKIDGIFIDEFLTDEKSKTFIETVIQQAGEKGVVAEKIESLEQVNNLKEMGVRYGQGYYFAKPALEPIHESKIEYLNKGNFKSNIISAESSNDFFKRISNDKESKEMHCC